MCVCVCVQLGDRLCDKATIRIPYESIVYPFYYTMCRFRLVDGSLVCTLVIAYRTIASSAATC